MDFQKLTFTIKDVIGLTVFVFSIGFGASEYKNLIIRVNSNSARITAIERAINKPYSATTSKKQTNNSLQFTLWRKED